MINMPTMVPTRTVSERDACDELAIFFLIFFLLPSKITHFNYGLTFKNFFSLTLR